jgi:hypothetical protein
MGFNVQLLTSAAVPLPMIAGPETLRPILSEGLPYFTPSPSLNYLSERLKQNFRTFLKSTRHNGRPRNCPQVAAPSNNHQGLPLAHLKSGRPL